MAPSDLPVIEGRIDSLAEAAAVLAGMCDLGIAAAAACFRDPRDALAAPLLAERPVTLQDIAEADYAARLACATQILRRQADGVIVQVRTGSETATGRPEGSARVVVIAEAMSGERREEALSRLAGAVTCASAALTLLPARRRAAFAADAPEALAVGDADWLLAVPPSCGVTPALGDLIATLDRIDPAVDVVQPAVALVADQRLSGVWSHDPGVVLVRARALRTGRAPGLPSCFAALRKTMRAIAAGAPDGARLVLPPEAGPVLWRARMPATSDAALLRLACALTDAQAAGAALVRRIVLEAMARSGEPARAIAEILPATLERLRPHADGDSRATAALDAAMEIASGGSPLGPILACEAGGLIFRPDLAWDQDDYLARNPDLALRRLRGEDIDPVDHLLNEGAIEGRPIRRRQIVVTSFVADRESRLRVAEAAELGMAMTRAADPGGQGSEAGSPRLPRARMAALMAEGRVAAAAALALDQDGWPAPVAWPALARMGLAQGLLAVLSRRIAALPAGRLDAAMLTALFDAVLPMPGAAMPLADAAQASLADRIVALLFARAPRAAGLRAVDHALSGGAYGLAAQRLAHLLDRDLVPMTAALARLRALCDWGRLIRLAQANATLAEQESETLFYARLYGGDLDGAMAGLEEAPLRPGQRLMFGGIAAYLTARFDEAHRLFLAASAAGGGPDHYPLLMWQHLDRGETGKADAVFAKVCLIDRDFRRSMLDIARYFEKCGDPASGARVLRRDLVSDAASDWLRQPKLYYLTRMLLMAGQTDAARRAISAFQAHGTAGSPFSEPPRQQLTVSMQGFAPGLTARPPRMPDEGIATVLGWMEQDSDATFVFGGFQSGDCYLFLYAWTARPRKAGRTILIVPRRLADLAALFSDVFDEVRVAEIACYYTLRNRLVSTGLLARAVIGHLDFLLLGEDGAIRPCASLPGHYLLMVKQALGLPLDGSGRHPAPTRPSPLPRGRGRRALIVPMAQSLLPLDPAIWREVVDRLSAAGFEVLINRGPDDPPLGATGQEVGFEREAMLALAHDCDLIIGLRSGLLDILSGSPARLVEVYNSQVGAGGFLHAWELAGLRPGRETRVVRLVEGQASEAEAVDRIIAAALGE